MKKTRKTTKALIMVVLAILLAFSVYSQSSPSLPHLFYGTSKVEGTNTPSGTVIIAKVNGVEKGRFTTTESGKYGAATGKKLVVQGATGGSTVEFYISTIKADQTAVFDSGEIDELNLTLVFPDEISFEGNIANEPILCIPGTDTEISNSGLTVEISCDENSAATLNNISNLGTSFFIGAPVPGGVLNISNVYEISVTGDVDIIVTMSYDDTGIDESTIIPYKFVNGAWVAQPDLLISRDTTANTITFRVPTGGTPYTAFGSAPAPPAPTGAAVAGAPSGGGGCTYDWQCTSWSECSPNGKQTRTCTNKGTCADDFGKPAEAQDCIYTAPEAEEEEAPSAPTAPTVTPPAPTAPVPTGFAALTGAFISDLKKPSTWIGIIVAVLVVAALYAGYYYLYKKK